MREKNVFKKLLMLNDVMEENQQLIFSQNFTK